RLVLQRDDRDPTIYARERDLIARILASQLTHARIRVAAPRRPGCPQLCRWRLLRVRRPREIGVEPVPLPLKLMRGQRRARLLVSRMLVLLDREMHVRAAEAK